MTRTSSDDHSETYYTDFPTVDETTGPVDVDDMPVDQVSLTTVGIDIGSATTHFLVSRVTLRRLGAALMSRFEVVNTEEIYRSGILLTPYCSSDEIDRNGLEHFFTDHFAASGVTHNDLDTGVVMLTGEAARKSNARAIATLFARSAGKFVCTSAGHHLEARMAASGSGALAASRHSESPLLNVDMGGGTTKFTIVERGEIIGTAALNVGGRLVAFEGSRVVRLDEAARRAAEECGIALKLGQSLSDDARQLLARTLAASVAEYLTTDPSVFSQITRDLLLTPPLADLTLITDIVISGGVSEYIGTTGYDTHDLGPLLASEFVTQAAAAGREIRRAPEGMRATVAGLSQFTTQLSGDTVHVSSTAATPQRNLPVVEASIDQLGDDFEPDQVARALQDGLKRSGRQDLLDPVAISLRWSGRPYFRNLATIAEGTAMAATRYLPDGPIVLILSQDCAQSLGAVLANVVDNHREVLCIDGVTLRSNDFIDVGEPIQNGHVLPVVVKTLVFPEVRASASPLDSTPPGTDYPEIHGRIRPAD